MRGIGGALLVGVLLLSGCGAAGATPAEKAAASKSAAAEQAAKDRAKAAARKRARQMAAYEECRTVLVGLDNRLSELDSRLAVGMQFAEYGTKVGAANVAYDKAVKVAKQHGGVSTPCVNRVARPLQSALQSYAKAYDVWNTCNSDVNCDLSTGDAKRKTQGAWSDATRKIAKAESGLASLQPE